MASPKRKGSQFSGAAAMFQKKEKEMLEKGSLPAVSPRPTMNKFGNSSVGNIGYSPTRNSAHLQPPPFVSPGAGASRPSWKKSASHYPSSYLDKHSGTPSQRSKPRAGLDGIGGQAFSPSPDVKGKPKVNSQSWRDKPTISFQATSPGALQKKTARPSSNQHFGGSFLNLDKTSDSKDRQSKYNDSSIGVFEETPDIKIEVKIPDIDKKIRARRASQHQEAIEQSAKNVPEWKLKFQQRTWKLCSVTTRYIVFTQHSQILNFSIKARQTEPAKKTKNRKDQPH
jgi:hypothetical protein